METPPLAILTTFSQTIKKTIIIHFRTPGVAVSTYDRRENVLENWNATKPSNAYRWIIQDQMGMLAPNSASRTFANRRLPPRLSRSLLGFLHF